MKRESQVDIQSYVNFMDRIYRRLLKQGLDTGISVGEVIDGYLAAEGELEAALGNQSGWLTESFAQYLRMAIQRNLEEVKQSSEDADWQARYTFYIDFTECLIRLRLSQAPGNDVLLKGTLRQVVEPMWKHHRSLVCASTVDLMAVTDADKRDSGALVQQVFWGFLQAADRQWATTYASAYAKVDKVSEDVRDQREQAFLIAAAHGFVKLSAVLKELATQYYDNKAANAASLIKKVVVAYDEFFQLISPELIGWVECSEPGAGEIEVYAYQVVGRLGPVLADVASLMSDHDYSFLSWLSQGAAGINLMQSQVMAGESPFFASCYCLLFSMVLSVQTGLYDTTLRQVEVVVQDKSKIERQKAQRESDQVFESISSEGFNAVSKAQDQRREGLIAFFACTIILSPFIPFVIRHYRKQKQRLASCRESMRGILRQGLSGMTGSVQQKREWAVSTVMGDTGLGQFTSVLCSRRHLRRSLTVGCASPAAR